MLMDSVLFKFYFKIICLYAYSLQVSRPHMNNQHFLEGAVARYKGFLYLIKRNRERSIKCFCVPTYDIDLIWHSHQLHPVSYCKDLCKLVGKVLEHDDMDSDRTKGNKLDVGFSETTKQWEETFGSRYWRAGAMHRGSAPSPLTTTPYSPNMMTKKVVAPYDCQKIIQLPEVKVVEVVSRYLLCPFSLDTVFFIVYQLHFLQVSSYFPFFSPLFLSLVPFLPTLFLSHNKI